MASDGDCAGLRVGVDQHVARAAHGADEARLFGIVAQLAAQGGDVHVNRAVEHVVVAVADFLQQLLARLHAAPRAGQRGQQIELHRA